MRQLQNIFGTLRPAPQPSPQPRDRMYSLSRVSPASKTDWIRASTWRFTSSRSTTYFHDPVDLAQLSEIILQIACRNPLRKP